jgi:hypothetical protein
VSQKQGSITLQRRDKIMYRLKRAKRNRFRVRVHDPRNAKTPVNMRLWTARQNVRTRPEFHPPHRTGSSQAGLKNVKLSRTFFQIAGLLWSFRALFERLRGRFRASRRLRPSASESDFGSRAFRAEARTWLSCKSIITAACSGRSARFYFFSARRPRSSSAAMV